MKIEDNKEKGKIINIRDSVTADNAVQMTDEESDELFNQTVAKHKAQVRFMLLMLVFVAVVAFIYVFVYRASQPYDMFEEIFSEEITMTAGQKYVNMGSGILQYGLNGASYYSVEEKEAWSVVYAMSSPKVEVCGDYAVVYDQNGRQASIFCATSGCTGSISTNGEITKATVSQYGAVCLVTSEELSNDMLFFAKDGSKLEIRIHTLVSESGYPIDISFSPDGQMLVASYVYVDSGVMQNQIVFYNFDTTKNSGAQTVGAYRKYGDTLFADVAFISNDRAIACGDGKVVFYSLKNRTSPQEISIVETKQSITSLTYSAAGVAYATLAGDMVQNHQLFMYNANGELVYQTETNFDIEDMQLTENGLYLSGAGKLLYLNNKGKTFYHGNLETGIAKINASLGATEFLLVGSSRFSYYKLIRK